MYAENGVLFWIIVDIIFSFKFNSFIKGRIGREGGWYWFAFHLSDFGYKIKLWNNAKGM